VFLGDLPPAERNFIFFKKGVKFSKDSPIYITSKGTQTFTQLITYSKEAVIQQFKEE
jgi:hypothetical protein